MRIYITPTVFVSNAGTVKLIVSRKGQKDTEEFFLADAPSLRREIEGIRHGMKHIPGFTVTGFRVVKHAPPSAEALRQFKQIHQTSATKRVRKMYELGA